MTRNEKNVRMRAYGEVLSVGELSFSQRAENHLRCIAAK